MSTTIEAWHARIAETPEDIDLRLVFADWLIERGDTLGDFIQLECRLLREPRHADALKWRRQANAMRKSHEKSWWGNVGTTTVRGGMIEGARSNSRKVFDQLERVAPALAELEIPSERRLDEEERAALGAHPLWRRVRRLDVYADAVLPVLAALEADNLPNLERLRATSIGARLDPLLSLLERRAPRLERLEIPNAGANDASIVRLGAWNHSLVTLDLYGNSLSPDAVASLASGRLLQGIRELRLGRTDIGPEGVVALAACRHLATLERLDLRRAGLSSKTAGAVASLMASAPRLGAAALEACRQIATRERPDPRRAGSSSKTADVAGALAALVASTPRLVALELMSARVGPEEMATITARDSLPALRELSLHGCGIGDGGLARLLDSALARRLDALNLRNNGLSDGSARALAESPALSGLRLLNLESNPFTEMGLEILRDAPALENVTITAGSLGSQLFAEAHNEKEGLWLGSTNYKEYNVLRRPASAKQRKTTKKGSKKLV